jgi:hypothetical protein
MTEAVVFFIEKRQRTDAHSNYCVEHSSVKALPIVESRKNSANNTLQRFLVKTKEF